MMKYPWTAKTDLPSDSDRDIYGDVVSLAALDSIATALHRDANPRGIDALTVERSIAAARSVL